MRSANEAGCWWGMPGHNQWEPALLFSSLTLGVRGESINSWDCLSSLTSTFQEAPQTDLASLSLQTLATMYPRIHSACSRLHFPSSSLFYKFSLSFFVSFISLGINVFVYETFSHSKELTPFLTLKIHCLDLISRKFETFNEQKIWAVRQHS